MIRQLRIGIPVIANEEWMGGVYYVINLLKALNSLPENKRPKRFLFVDAGFVPHLELYAEALTLVDGVIFGGVDPPSSRRVHTPRSSALAVRVQSELSIAFPYISARRRRLTTMSPISTRFILGLSQIMSIQARSTLGSMISV